MTLSPRSTNFEPLGCEAIAGDFSSAMIHDLRNTLTSIKLAVQTLQRNSHLSERDGRRLQIAHRELRAVERTLSLWAELGRQTPPNMRRHSLGLLVQEALDEVAPELEKKEVTVTLPKAPLEAWVNIDARRLVLPLSALFWNIAARLSSGVPLDIGWSVRKGQAELWVQDATVRGKDRASPENHRTQLSLAALSHVVRLHRGSLHVLPGEAGTLFAITLESP